MPLQRRIVKSLQTVVASVSTSRPCVPIAPLESLISALGRPMTYRVRRQRDSKRSMASGTKAMCSSPPSKYYFDDLAVRDDYVNRLV